MSKKTTEDFINDAHIVHGDMYDYSPTIYKTAKQKVKIRCRIHGVFEQTPNDHLNGHGCPICKSENSKSLIFGVGLNDIVGGRNLKSYTSWSKMMQRCYSLNWKEKHPTYNDCIVCDEWHTLSKFNEWFNENYIEGYSLDKDILVKGNKIYSPDTCCFVPKEINSIFKDSRSRRGKLPAGIIKHKNMYVAQTTFKGERQYLGTFSNVESAFMAYCQARKKYTKRIAQEYYNRGDITKKVYDALMKYEVEITD